MMFLQMAWKNLFRYKKRTVVTAVAIAVGVCVSIVINGMLTGMDSESERNLIWYETSSAQIFNDSYFAERDMLPQYFIDTEKQVEIDSLLTAARVAFSKRYKVASELYFLEEFFDTAGSIQVVLTAVDPVRDASVYRVHEGIESGEWFQSNETEAVEGIVIGSRLAEDIEAKIGDRVIMQCRGRGGFYQAVEVPIIGIIHTANPILNAGGVFMDIAYADEVLELNGGITEYVIADTGAQILSDIRIEGVRNAVSFVDGVEVYSWREVAADILQLAKSKSSMSTVLLLFVFIIAVVGILNTMLMAVMERRREIAMLKSLGYKNGGIRMLFLCEGFFIGCLGSLVGFVAGMSLNAYFVYRGLDFGNMFDTINIGYRISSVMYSAWNMQSFVSVAVIAVGISAIAAWFPSGRILKDEIAVILRKD